MKRRTRKVALIICCHYDIDCAGKGRRIDVAVEIVDCGECLALETESRVEDQEKGSKRAGIERDVRSDRFNQTFPT